jgi:hypothetical protein
MKPQQPMMRLKPMLKENILADVSYQKVETRGKQVIHGDRTFRVIIPTHIPRPRDANVKAIDVTNLSEDDRQRTLDAWNQYQDYLEVERKHLFAFDEFVAVRLNDTLPETKWRTFKPEQLSETE